MTWNYRVIKTTYGDDVDEVEYAIHEVFYDKNGLIRNHTVEPVDPHSLSLEGLRDVLRLMIECLDKEILIFEEMFPDSN